MRFPDLFQTFSRRRTSGSPPSKRLTQSFRTRVLMLCRDTFGPAGCLDDFWHAVHTKLSYLHGATTLHPSQQAGRLSRPDDVLTFLTNCSDEHFLDFIELIFRVNVPFGESGRESLVADINEFLQVDALPYTITPYVWTRGAREAFGRVYETMSLTGYPQVIRKDSELVYSTAIEPTLVLVADARFSAASAELYAALRDFRQAEYGDCLTKCGSAFESVLKVICQIRGWSHKQTDTAAPLLKAVITNAGLEPFLEQPLLLIATLRNRLSSAHGSGTQARVVSAAKAEYTLNATASAILFLIREAT